MQLFIYKLKLNESFYDFSKWSADVQKTFTKHAEYLKSGIDQGKVLVVGRSDSEPQDNFGIVIFKADDLKTATEFANSDPAVRDGIMSVNTQPFKLLTVTPEALKWNIW